MNPFGLKGLDYLNSLPPWRGQNGFDLKNIKAVLCRLGNPQDRFRTIHVAGTNGKGSCAVGIASILAQRAGSKVGLTISPHLSQLNERVVIDGLPLDLDLLGTFALQVKVAAQSSPDITLSFFEALTAAAFLSFHEYQVDWAVIETGLGGRLDATNVITKPEACVLTSVSLDHEKLLGAELGLIAREKAHIARPSVPFICGPLGPDELREVQFVCSSFGAPLYAINQEISVTKHRMLDDGRVPFRLSLPGVIDGEFCSSLAGSHQCYNAALAAVVGGFLGFSSEMIGQGLTNFYWPARLELLSVEYADLLMDAAHNEEGARSLANHLKLLHLSQLECVFGVLDTKNWRGMISTLTPYVKKWLLLSPDSPNALDLNEIASYLSGNGINFEIFGDDYQRLVNYLKLTKEPLPFKRRRPILATGSIYMLGKLRDMLMLDSDSRPLWRVAKPSGVANL